MDPIPETQTIARPEFTTQHYMFEIFKYVSQLEVISVIQCLNRAYYFHLAPMFVKQILFYVPKIATKHEFIHMVRTMNQKTHQYKQIDFSMSGLNGKLCGEFLKTVELPDGRCKFSAKDQKIQILCYFKNGFLQKGPRLHFNRATKTLCIRSNT